MKSFEKKLTGYSALATAFIGLATETADAEIIYTDISPDITIDVPGLSYLLDLDNDGIGDFGFTFSTTYFIYSTFYGAFNFYIFNGIFVDPKNGNSIAAFTGSSGAYAYPYVIDSGIEIGASAGAFKPDSFQTMVYQFYAILQSYFYYPIIQAGDWIFGEEDKFVGLKLNAVDSTYYGWARVSVAANNRSFTIKDYAYNNKPDSSIQTELFPVGIIENNDPEINVYSYGNQINIILEKTNLDNATFNLIDLSGRRVFSSVITNRQESFIINDIASGIYVAEIFIDFQHYTKKVYLSGK